MKFLRLLAAALLLAAGNAHAVYTVYMYQSGGNVIASGSGTLNPAGLTPSFVGPAVSRVQGGNGSMILGATGTAQTYDGLTGPASMGVGASFITLNNAGDKVGAVTALNRLLVPNGYVAGSPLSSTSTWVGNTIAGMGVTPGTYTWTWPGDTFVLNVGMAPPPPGAATPAAVPTLSQWGAIVSSVMLAFFGLAGLRSRRYGRAASQRERGKR